MRLHKWFKPLVFWKTDRDGGSASSQLFSALKFEEMQHRSLHIFLIFINCWFEYWHSHFFLQFLQVYATYSRVHISSDSLFSKILKRPFIVQKKMMPHIKGLDFSQRWGKKKFKMADSENSKWPPQKNLIFQLRQFSIFFHEIFMDWSLG